MLSKEYLCTARTLCRIALNMTDEKIADRLETLAKQYGRRAQKVSVSVSTNAVAPPAARGERHGCGMSD
ncbi:hypothetical protein V1289_002868 [Bradyrhizobium sp. AZCC 2289]